MDTFKNILVVSRSTENCIKVLETGISMARNCNAKLHVLHVIYDPYYYNGWNFPFSTFNEEIEKLSERAREEIAEIIRAEKAEGMDIEETIKYGKPIDEIQRIVEAEGVDLILMQAHEEGRLEHFLFGRTNEDVIRHMPATLMLVKARPFFDGQQRIGRQW